jgi:hypothetical protein
MDLTRAAVKAIYYDYPIENAYGMIVGADSKGGFLEFFSRMVGDNAQGFGPRDIDAFKASLLRELKGQGFRRENDIQLFVGLPLLFAEKVLTKDEADYPRVKFTNLFRWREVVKYIGEDLFTTAFLARADKKDREDFFWTKVIRHDDGKINAALESGLSDIHSHFGGAIDSFEFNWINLMNDVGELYDKFESMSMRYSLNPVVAFNKEYSFKNLANWCRVAAGIRVCLYKVLMKGHTYRKEDVLRDLQTVEADSGSEELTQLKSAIDTLRSEAKKTCDRVILDYAINEGLIAGNYALSPYCLYAGERQLEYAFYRAYLRPQSPIKGFWVELFYLYELIKTHLRREFVCANEMSGLDNYIGFSARAALFTEKTQNVCNVSAMQTSLRQGKDDHLETRVTSNALGLTKGDYWKGLYSDEPFLDKDEMRERLTFVIQLTKGGLAKAEHKEGRYYKKRKEIHNEYNKVACFKDSKQSAYDIVGLDVGGMELFYRPEVFAHMLRSGKEQGFWITYHVGEEFYDIVDGIRAVWEIIRFTDSHPIDRLGHCLALGMKAESFYQKRSYTLSMPKQVLLDNIVWLCCFAKQNGIKIKDSLYERLSELAKEVYEQLGYARYIGELCMDDYYESMLLRSDEANGDDGLDCWSRTAELDTAMARSARANANAVVLNKAYKLDSDLIEEGENTIQEKFDTAFMTLVAKAQEKMIELVNKTGICIEGCPSSNLQICKLERYDCHPAIRYYLTPEAVSFWHFFKKPKMNYAICTDDKGTFSTSLYNEFSLLALAATKKKGWNKKTEKLFAELILQGNKYRFKKASNEN